MEKIGKTTQEIDANLIFECRQIVKNIISFGVSEQQKIKIIELFALELESRDVMMKLLKVLEEVKNMDDSIKFSLTSDQEEYNKKVNLLDV